MKRKKKTIYPAVHSQYDCLSCLVVVFGFNSIGVFRVSVMDIPTLVIL